MEKVQKMVQAMMQVRSRSLSASMWGSFAPFDSLSRTAGRRRNRNQSGDGCCVWDACGHQLLNSVNYLVEGTTWQTTVIGRQEGEVTNAPPS